MITEPIYNIATGEIEHVAPGIKAARLKHRPKEFRDAKEMEEVKEEPKKVTRKRAPRKPKTD